MNKININSGNVEINLSIDGLEEKGKELMRVSWALDDRRFKVHLNEKDTDKHKDIEIDGHGGG